MILFLDFLRFSIFEFLGLLCFFSDFFLDLKKKSLIFGFVDIFLDFFSFFFMNSLQSY